MSNSWTVDTAEFDNGNQLLLPDDTPNQSLFMVPSPSLIPLPPLLLLFDNNIDECLPIPADLLLSRLPPPPLQPLLFHVQPHNPIELPSHCVCGKCLRPSSSSTDSSGGTTVGDSYISDCGRKCRGQG